MNDEYYKILDLQPGAPQHEIKSAYKRKAAIFHPDNKETGNNEQFLKVQEAYEVLTGKSKKKAQQTQQEKPFNWQDGFFGKGFEFNPFDFWTKSGAGYGAFYTQEPSPRPPVNDADVRATIQTNVEEIKNGKVFHIKYKKAEGCKKCKGKGAERKEDCGQCHGAGYINHTTKNAGYTFIQQVPCEQCGVRGYILVNPCSDCNSKGYIEKEERLSFKMEVIDYK